jgi:FKBP-type peptidyl-prolyl cis-trans isomerase SlyD
MRSPRPLPLVLGLALLAGSIAAADEEVKPAPPVETALPVPAIEAGSTVSLEYTLTDDDGKVLDSSQGRDPLTYVQGESQIVPGLEKALAGMHSGEQKQVTVSPGEGYGEVDPAAVAEVPKGLIPADALNVGTELVARNSQGTTRLVRVKEVKDETVVLDLNHPLAGKTLHFDVKVVGVEPPAK